MMKTKGQRSTAGTQATAGTHSGLALAWTAERGFYLTAATAKGGGRGRK